MVMFNYKWFFPPNAEGGQPEGLNDSGVENFRGNQIESLAREIIQNSTDARKNYNNPVKVTFNKLYVENDSFPKTEELLNAFKSCSNYKRTPVDAKKFFDNGIEVLKQNKLSFLKISDFNTTGLSGVNQEASNWEDLVKSVGISNKGGSSGGSFGIGKSAPFACSELRTVFYSTLNENGEYGFQGVSRLASHEQNQSETRGTGFFGIKKDTQAITDPANFPKWVNRDEYGTDVYIAAFLSDKNWKEKIITAVIENFFIAVYEENLIVEVDDIVISSSNLKSLIDKYIKPIKKYYADEFFSAITFGEPKKADIEGLGEVQLYLKKDDDFSKKVAMVRNTGMKITHMQNFRGGTKFSGVLIIRGDKLNELLRKTEPPAHNKWEASRHENPKYAEKVIKNMEGFVRKTVRDMNKVMDSTTINFKGFNQFLPDHLNEDTPLDDKGFENNNKEYIPKSMKISVRRNKKKNRQTLANQTDKRSKSESNNNKNKTKGENKETSSKAKNKNKLKVTRIRSIAVDETRGIYDLKIKASGGGVGNVELNFVGEDAKTYKTNIISAVDDTNKQIDIGDSSIGPVTFKKNEKKVIRITFGEQLRASLEVKINEG